MKFMENKLKALFDFQKFEGNADLQQVIDSVHSRYSASGNRSGRRELSLDDMEWVNAAGQPYQERKKNEHD